MGRATMSTRAASLGSIPSRRPASRAAVACPTTATSPAIRGAASRPTAKFGALVDLARCGLDTEQCSDELDQRDQPTRRTADERSGRPEIETERFEEVDGGLDARDVTDVTGRFEQSRQTRASRPDGRLERRDEVGKFTRRDEVEHGQRAAKWAEHDVEVRQRSDHRPEPPITVDIEPATSERSNDSRSIASRSPANDSVGRPTPWRTSVSPEKVASSWKPPEPKLASSVALSGTGVTPGCISSQVRMMPPGRGRWVPNSDVHDADTGWP